MLIKICLRRIRYRLSAAAAVCCAVLCGTLCPALAAWQIETVDSSGRVGYFSSLALDRLDAPHIAYYDATNDTLKYAKYNSLLRTWALEGVDNTGDVGMNASIALNRYGKALISYLDDTRGSLKYARSSGKPGVWTIEVIDDGQFIDDEGSQQEGYVGTDSSVAIDSHDLPHFSYCSLNYEEYTALWYAYKSGDTWQKGPVDDQGDDVGYFSSIAMTSSDSPRISYYDESHGDLKYAWLDYLGWHIEVVDSNGTVGSYTSMGLDRLGNPHISYYDIDNGDLKYAYRTGTGWHVETVDSDGYVGTYTSLAIDSGNNPHISYYDESRADLKYAFKYRGAWYCMTIDSGGDVGTYTSIALDSQGAPHISYLDETHGDLKYASASGRNTPPTASFTVSPATGDLSTLFRVDASGCKDTEDAAGKLEVHWQWQPGSMWTDFTTVKTATHRYAAGGTHTITLEVVDTGGLTATATRQVQVNSPPQAAFTVTPSSGDTTTVFRMDASASSDTEDAAAQLQVRWDWENDNTWDTAFTVTKTAGHAYATTGTKTIRLEVRDSRGATARTTQQIIVLNAAPVASFSLTPASGDTATTFTVDASASSDAEDRPANLRVHWQWQEGGMWTDFTTLKTATHRYASPGIYTITLQVLDSGGRAAAASRQVQVAQANTPPVAAFNATPRSGDTATAFAFDAALSRDAEDPAELLALRWDWENDGTWDTPLTTVRTAAHTFATPGTYTIQLEVRDSAGLNAIATQQIQVTRPNMPPIAGLIITPPQGSISTVFTLDASGSRDTEDSPETLAVHWQLDSGAMWSDFATVKTITNTFLTGGIHTVTVEVVDSSGLTDNATVQVAVNSPPTAAFGVNPTSGEIATQFSVDASAVQDAEDSAELLEVRWDWDSNGTWDTEFSQGKTAQHAYAQEGIYTIAVQVRDTGGLIAAATQQVQVIAAAGDPNTPPIAAFTVAPAAGGDTATEFLVDATGCSDAEDALADLKVHWQWDTGGMWTDFTTVKTAAHQYATAGTHTITLEVVDKSGLSATAIRQVVVTQANTAPVAAFSIEPTTGDTNTLFSVDATLSHDAEDASELLEIRWDWESNGIWDTPFAVSKTASHSYPAEGTYTISLQVRDSAGLTGTATQQVRVKAPARPNTPPVADFSISPAAGNTATAFVVDASACTDAEDPASKLVVHWQWEEGGMWTDFAATKTATHGYPSSGTYTIALEVVDTKGLTATASQQVVVAQANTPPVAAFTVTPTTGDTSTDFVLNAGLTHDAEDSPGSLLLRWDWETDNVWDTAFRPEKNASHRYASTGLFTITLEARDSAGLTASVTQQVQVAGANSPPQAAFSVTPAAGDTDTVFQVDASGCSDAQDGPSDLLVHWQWQANGMWTDFSAMKTATHQYTAAGVHSITLEVFDSAGLTAAATRQVTVSQARTPPQAAFTVTPTIGSRSTEFTVDASGSTDMVDSQSQLQVRWDWDGNASWDTAFSAVRTATHTYPADGLYSIILEVRNSQGLSATARQQVKVITPGGSEDNESDTTLTTTSIASTTTTMPEGGGHDTSTTTPGTPTPDEANCREASFSASQTSGPAPLSIQFAAYSSIAGTGCFWSFGDGAYSYAQSPSHTYKDPGTYTVVLRVNEIECTRANLITVEEQCPVSLALGSSARARENIAMLQSYRDRVLRTHPAGAVLVGFYYQHAREVSGILARDPILKRRSAGLLDQLVNVAAAALGGTQPAVTPAQLAAAQELLNLIAAQGSPSLQATIRFILRWTSSQAFLQQLGVMPPKK